MFVILYKVMEKLGELPVNTSVQRLEDFKDSSSISDYALNAMKLLTESGVITGDDSKLMPLSSSSRAQAVQVLYNLQSR